MKAISFLGVARYSPTTYVYQEREYTTEFFAEALPHFYPDLDEVLVFATPTVRGHDNWTALQERLGKRLRAVCIPEGHSEDELWEIFDALIGAVDEGEEVLFDITNSFRSIPLLVFIAAAYLRTARRVRMRGLIYGAFEARDRDTGRTPVFDLTPFVSLLDWLTATNQFIHTGDARYLAHLLAAQGEERQSSALRKAGESLSELSLAMMLCRPLEAMQQAGGMAAALSRAEVDLAHWARPFSLLSERIRDEYADRALADPAGEGNTPSSLRQQLHLVQWYLENNQVIQVVTLAREWVVTAAGWRLGRGFVLQTRERETLERGLGGIIRMGREQADGSCFGLADLNDEGRALWQMAERDALCALWTALTSVRNDLDHAGMRPGPMKAAKLARKARDEVWPRLRTLAHAWQIVDEDEAER